MNDEGLDAKFLCRCNELLGTTCRHGKKRRRTIHRPSIDIFEAFNEVRLLTFKAYLLPLSLFHVLNVKPTLHLFLMKRGGHRIYVGPQVRYSCHLIKYFEFPLELVIARVSKIKEAYNPPTWMLEVTATSQKITLGVDFADLYKKSDLYKRNKALITQLTTTFWLPILPATMVLRVNIDQIEPGPRDWICKVQIVDIACEKALTRNLISTLHNSLLSGMRIKGGYVDEIHSMQTRLNYSIPTSSLCESQSLTNFIRQANT
ncbi:hypothetical protein H5410_038900 [Solanum commersonii]|uniref:Uncharacterized protein n=1 Tax=Solanum commersonii TaxID=4109 RepID=A0A9J5YEH6_SOLCO|nr:hypothetical protein H5410_038900 [Solanum commersonii]